MTDDPITQPIQIPSGAYGITPDPAWNEPRQFPRDPVRDGRHELNFTIKTIKVDHNGITSWAAAQDAWRYDLYRDHDETQPRPTIWQRFYADHWVMLVMYTLIIAVIILIIIAAIIS